MGDFIVIIKANTNVIIPEYIKIIGRWRNQEMKERKVNAIVFCFTVGIFLSTI